MDPIVNTMKSYACVLPLLHADRLKGKDAHSLRGLASLVWSEETRQAFFLPLFPFSPLLSHQERKQASLLRSLGLRFPLELPSHSDFWSFVVHGMGNI